MASKNYVYELYGKMSSLDIAQSCVAIAALLHLALTSAFGCMITCQSEVLIVSTTMQSVLLNAF